MVIDPLNAPHFTTARRDALAASIAAQAETKRAIESDRTIAGVLDQAAQAAALAATKGDAEDNPIAFLKSRAERRAHGAAG